MWTWSIRARAWRSASKRATTWRVSMPALMTFRATWRRTGLLLLGHVDRAHAPLADLLEQLVRADDRTGALRARPRGSGGARVRSLGLRDVAGLRITGPASGGLDRRADRPRRGPQEMADPLVVLQQRLDLRPQPRVAPAGLVQVGRPPRPVAPGEGLAEDRLELGRVHRGLRK